MLATGIEITISQPLRGGWDFHGISLPHKMPTPQNFEAKTSESWRWNLSSNSLQTMQYPRSWTASLPLKKDGLTCRRSRRSGATFWDGRISGATCETSFEQWTIWVYIGDYTTQLQKGSIINHEIIRIPFLNNEGFHGLRKGPVFLFRSWTRVARSLFLRFSWLWPMCSTHRYQIWSDFRDERSGGKIQGVQVVGSWGNPHDPNKMGSSIYSWRKKTSYPIYFWPFLGVIMVISY